MRTIISNEKSWKFKEKIVFALRSFIFYLQYHISEKFIKYKIKTNDSGFPR